MEEKKESRIAKLIELLNEYHHFTSDLIYYWWNEEYETVYFHSELSEKEKKKLRKAGIYNEEDDWVDEVWIWDEWICSKKFWFIKWLVDNDKIDRVKLGKIWMYWDLEQCRIDMYNAVLMLLAIQYEPINFLISILK